MSRCDFCGAFRAEHDPHPDTDGCPHESREEVPDAPEPEESLVEAVKRTVPGNSVMLYGWNLSYPMYKTVYRTEMELPYTEEPTGSTEFQVPTEYWTKTIWTAGYANGVFRIEYDPSVEPIIRWFSIEEGMETEKSKPFGVFYRKDKANISYFGSSLPD